VTVHQYEDETGDRTLCKRNVPRRPEHDRSRTTRACRWCESERAWRDDRNSERRRSYHDRIAED
jgi:hypothetical protein